MIVSLVTVWKSDTDGKLFEDKGKYQVHLRKLATHRRHQRKLKIANDKADAIWAELYEREQSIEQWARMVIENQHLFWAEAASGEPRDWDRVGKDKRDGVVMPVPRLLEFTKLNLKWSDSVSNSHSCPVGGVQNWGGRDKFEDGTIKPSGYPGWAGSIEWMCEWPKEFTGVHIASHLFACGTFNSGRQRAHTGTGGFRGEGYSKMYDCDIRLSGYDFRLYAADWPGMARYYEKKRVWDIITKT